MHSELDKVLAAIEAKQFTALSHGIGLGETRPINRAGGKGRPARQVLGDLTKSAAPSPAHAPSPPPPRPSEQAAKAMRPMASRAQVAPLPTASSFGPAPAPARGAAGGASRRVLAWGLDFLMVAATLTVAFALAALLTAVRTGETDNPLALAPVQWLVGTKPYFILVGVYAAFLAYGLLFKVLGGATLGESLLRVRRMPKGKVRQSIGGGAP